MTNTERTAKPLGLDYGAHALEQVRAAVKGNGVKPDDIRIESLNGEIVEFEAATVLTLQTKILEKILGGKITGPQQVESPQELRDAIEAARQNAVQNPEVLAQIKNHMLTRDDKGFALQGEIIALEFLKKEFVSFEACGLCRAKGSIQCQRCHGQGREMCPRCNGQGMELCTTCQGNGIINNNQGQQQCHRCQGQRRTSCTLCDQRRKIPCQVCKTKGETMCKQCNGNAWNSRVTTLGLEAQASFEYARDHVPAALAAQIDAHAKSLADYVQITPIENTAPPAHDRIILKYRVVASYAQAQFVIGAETVEIFLFGTEGKILSAPNFIETLIRPGTAKLKAAAQGKGAPETLLNEAMKYRAIKLAVLAAGKYKKSRAVKAVLQNIKLGLSEQGAKALVIDADAAIDSLTKKSRQAGILMAAGIALAIGAGYTFTPLRELLQAHVGQDSLHILIDALVGGAALAFGYVVFTAWGKKGREAVLKRLAKK